MTAEQKQQQQQQVDTVQCGVCRRFSDFSVAVTAHQCVRGRKQWSQQCTAACPQQRHAPAPRLAVSAAACGQWRPLRRVSGGLRPRRCGGSCCRGGRGRHASDTPPTRRPYRLFGVHCRRTPHRTYFFRSCRLDRNGLPASGPLRPPQPCAATCRRATQRRKNGVFCVLCFVFCL